MFHGIGLGNYEKERVFQLVCLLLLIPVFFDIFSVFTLRRRKRLPYWYRNSDDEDRLVIDEEGIAPDLSGQQDGMELRSTSARAPVVKREIISAGVPVVILPDVVTIDSDSDEARPDDIGESVEIVCDVSPELLSWKISLPTRSNNRKKWSLFITKNVDCIKLKKVNIRSSKIPP